MPTGAPVPPSDLCAAPTADRRLERRVWQPTTCPPTTAALARRQRLRRARCRTAGRRLAAGPADRTAARRAGHRRTVAAGAGAGRSQRRTRAPACGCCRCEPRPRRSARWPTLPYAPALRRRRHRSRARACSCSRTRRARACWAIEQSLRAAHLGALVGWLPHRPSRKRAIRRAVSPPSKAFRAMRRLQLLAQPAARRRCSVLRDARAAARARRPPRCACNWRARDGAARRSRC
ncbi:MAG: hypothetical protein MZW92_06895 [Comamonadaceae bacterium]|nr:hypothetical protein [Comamonadaceae bacterium]